jgi:hypothetical protein
MNGTDGPKSSVELAMERLRKKDEAAGGGPQVLSDAQKAAVAEVRGLYNAKLAQAEVLLQGSLRQTFDPDERAKIEEEYQRERARLNSEMDSKIEKARVG